MAGKKVLVVDDEHDIVALLKRLLELKNYKVITAYDGREAIEKMFKEKPDAVILDIMLPEMDGFEVCQRLRNDKFTHFVPIIFLSAMDEVSSKVKGMKVGADDYLTKPFDPQELEVRVEGVLRRTRAHISASPLTNLPGNISIEEEIKKRIARGEKFAVCYLDLDNFKAYNDKYGYERGDEVIQMISQILMEVVKEFGEKDDFIGHIGGDDFIIVTTPDRVDILSFQIINEFEDTIKDYYDEEDRRRGGIEVTDRKGNILKVPFISISIVVVTNEKKKLLHYGQVSEILAELKKYAKMKKGSVLLKDRRD
jgi:diguanylate cyclase (GGDEF)-like protein